MQKTYRSQWIQAAFGIVVLWLIAACSANLRAEVRVYPEGGQPDDERFEPLKDLNGYFPFEVPETKAEWEARAEKLRRRVLVATGLWPMPEKTPLNANVFGLTKRDGFTVEKVYFESLPGHYVTGLLFRPEGEGEGFPADRHRGDTDRNGSFNLGELPRMIQLYNSRAYACASTETVDGFEPGPGDTNCPRHTADFQAPEFVLDLSELLRVIQLHSFGAFTFCEELTEDSFCAVAR